MAASDTTVAVTAGSGISVATRTVDSAHRQKVVIGGAEDGESYVYLPAHDAADAGSPLKVGGRASLALPTAVSADGDRVNARFTREGAMAVVNVVTAGTVWVDGTGLVTTQSAFSTSSLNNSATTAVAAAGSGLRAYVTSVYALCVTTFGGAGYVTLRDNTTDILPVAGITAVNIGGPFLVAPPGGYLCRTTANTALNIYFSGTTSTIKWVVTYYIAP
jgi:hypothetical protein